MKHDPSLDIIHKILSFNKSHLNFIHFIHIHSFLSYLFVDHKDQRTFISLIIFDEYICMFEVSLLDQDIYFYNDGGVRQ